MTSTLHRVLSQSSIHSKTITRQTAEVEVSPYKKKENRKIKQQPTHDIVPIALPPRNMRHIHCRGVQPDITSGRRRRRRAFPRHLPGCSAAGPGRDGAGWAGPLLERRCEAVAPAGPSNNGAKRHAAGPGGGVTRKQTDRDALGPGRSAIRSCRLAAVSRPGGRRNNRHMAQRITFQLTLNSAQQFRLLSLFPEQTAHILVKSTLAK